MTRMEADDLAVRILEVFHGPPGHVWSEALEDLDAGAAGTALQRLIRAHDRRFLSIAEFLAMYRSVDTRDAETRAPQCVACSNSGWVDAGEFTTGDDERTYSCVQPCTCPEGAKRAKSAVWTNRPRPEVEAL